jgi:hypothetical protein
MSEITLSDRIALWEQGYWEVPQGINCDYFDFNWRPSYYDRPFIHQFGTQWQKTGGPRFIIPQAEGVKYQEFQKAIKLPNPNNFVILDDTIEFDFSWHPDEDEPPFIYVFTYFNDGVETKAIEYHVHNATDKKYVEITAKYKTPPIYKITKDNTLTDLLHLYSDIIFWAVPENIDDSNFDYLWEPNPYDPPYIHVFGTQWYDSDGPQLVIPNSQGTKKQSIQKVIRLSSLELYDITTTLEDLINERPNETFWAIPENLDCSQFDFGWKPYKYDPPYIHKFGTQWQKTGGPIYVVPDNQGVKYQDVQKAIKLPNKNNRSWRPLITNATIDFSWHPDEDEPPFIYVFGNQWHNSKLMPTFQYRVKGATEKKYIDNTNAQLLHNYSLWETPNDIEEGFDFSWVPHPHEPPFIYQFGTQWQKTGGPKYVMKNATTIKYIDELKAKKLPDKNNRSWRPLITNATIDFSWHPDDNEPPFIYVFGNQWYDSKLMPTFQYRVKGATEKKYVDNIKAELLPNYSLWETPDDIEEGFDFSWVPHPHEPPFIYQFGTQWQKTGGPKYVMKNATTIKYIARNAVKKPNVKNWRIIETIEKEEFDFSWHPDESEGSYTYVFGNQYHSAEHMPTLVYRMKNSRGTKYVSDIKATIKINEVPYEDSVFDSLMNHNFTTRYTFFGDQKIDYSTIISDDKNVYMHIIDNVCAIVPKEAKEKLYDKLTDFPYIKHHSLGLAKKPLDIIFLSNGEKGAEENYEHLLSLVKGLPNNVIGLKDIKGRVASQYEAANASSTPWYFLVNGKLKVNDNFDFSWQPDYLAKARHYIFRATNPVNDLEYGHMAIVANNKRLTLQTVGTGLDFTLDSPHEIVNINSGVGMFNTSKWDAWRTSFREVIKLKDNTETLGDEDSKNRLTTWMTVDQGNFGDWSIKGAKDAVDYYESVNGDFDKLKLSYDWVWLKEKYENLYP